MHSSSSFSLKFVKTVLFGHQELSLFMKTQTFYMKQPLFYKKENFTLSPYKKLQPLISAFIKNQFLGRIETPGQEMLSHLKNPFRSLQTNPKADAWWVVIICLFVEKRCFGTPLYTYCTSTCGFVFLIILAVRQKRTFCACMALQTLGFGLGGEH